MIKIRPRMRLDFLRFAVQTIIFCITSFLLDELLQYIGDRDYKGQNL